ncbi:hypothetical protein RBTH_08478 [Bacillus thuringiensis serovar israelensis ATCC 35646]|nr:hypothetical protein RBTH_08478 [Bacillus thuringiensis serovar israelensis ATCC 35646]
MSKFTKNCHIPFPCAFPLPQIGSTGLTGATGPSGPTGATRNLQVEPREPNRALRKSKVAWELMGPSKKFRTFKEFLGISNSMVPNGPFGSQR